MKRAIESHRHDDPNNAQEYQMSFLSTSHGASGAHESSASMSLSSLLIAAGRMTFGRVIRRRQFKLDALHVRDLPDHLLKDIGIQRGNIVAAVYGGRGRA
ncbi:MAG: hypothetical protein U1E67_03305 [Hyphomicrobiales bacterium]